MERGFNGNELFPLSSDQPKAKNIKNIIAGYLRYWYLFLLGAILSLGCAYLYIKYFTVPQYVVSSTLLIKDEKSGSALSNASTLGELELIKSTKIIDNEIEVIKSKGLMQRVVKELDLYTSYFVEGKIKDVEIYGNSLPIRLIINKLDSTAFGKSINIYLRPGNSIEIEETPGKISRHKIGQQINKSYGVFTVVARPGFSFSDESMGGRKIIVKFSNITDAAIGYSNALNVQPVNKNSNVLMLSMVLSIQEKGIDIIDKLIEVYNREAIEDKNIIATNTINFLDERLNYLITELSGVEKDVEEYKRENEVTDVSTQASSYIEQASTYNKQLSDWAIQIDVLESIESYLNQNNSQYRMVPSTLGIQDVTLLGLITRFNELQLERERMLLTVQPNNPLIHNINDQLDNLKVNILENLRNIKNGLKITSNNLKATSVQFKSRIRNVPVVERQLLEINRQQGIKQDLYLYILKKREEAALSLAATVSNTRIIDSATSSNIPVAPSKSVIYMMSLLLGLAIPFSILFVKELLNDKIQLQEDVEMITRTPVLGELPHNSVKESVVVTKNSRSPIVEMFRLIRANLHFAAAGNENKVILISSSMSGEGKTFFSINLGASIALTGKKVALIELDLRKPRLLKEIGLPEGTGITNFLVSGKVSIDDIIRPYEKIQDLYIIGAGPLPPNPAELLMNNKLGHLIAELRERFDYIIIDSAPVGQVADSYSLSSLVDSTIYLVRYNYTYKEQIKIVDGIYKNKMLPQPMIVLNDAKKENSTSYGYGYGYGYGYKEERKVVKRKKSVT